MQNSYAPEAFIINNYFNSTFLDFSLKVSSISRVIASYTFSYFSNFLMVSTIISLLELLYFLRSWNTLFLLIFYWSIYVLIVLNCYLNLTRICFLEVLASVNYWCLPFLTSELLSHYSTKIESAILSKAYWLRHLILCWSILKISIILSSFECSLPTQFLTLLKKSALKYLIIHRSTLCHKIVASICSRCFFD